ncbi:MAG TPA: succinylglutamate desuccinylase/aspartoacylase family protein [Flavobacteriaceae bacterium]|nr:succinylglutamate desuccinylase/aspartoacylase family protein [Flavobacteriaceae bacterium]MCB9213536.1 succinylglutamate desuccinylase/aspartoacylase family protein [Alteromonas sp.]HPF10762.1 succinylglutamate desuccinylase/aspartoacylase family protein [Flavobacteriaceae bacterium]HQU21530.1 succinylglutamate desuccinylase/aspartoacylase family protein [Flavobacteriaceae bacterium]HQU65499.1 succinylglutamate desuccinylase/aspartoacylase family protein [Flavobacteriaceae bacterium]
MIRNNTVEKKTTYHRIIGTFEGSKKGPTLIFVGGIHGNEPSGVMALQKAIQDLKPFASQFKGKMIALTGNIKALEAGVRFLEVDLNRQFTKDKLKSLQEKTPRQADLQEQYELLMLLEQILEVEEGPFYFFDLHTTSAETIPFLTINDSLLNRSFTKQYPLPIVLGIEEYLDGPLLSYINELGYVAFGFEGGQHQSRFASENHYSFIFLTLAFTGCLEKEAFNFSSEYQRLSAIAQRNQWFYEIIHRQEVPRQGTFSMEPGFHNFQRIHKRQLLAKINDCDSLAPYSGKIFMPLYQGKGEDGYFIIKRIPFIFLWLSRWLRNTKMDRILVWLPGVHWGDSNRQSLYVDKKIARFFTKEIFHLFGYRSKKIDQDHLVMKNREAASRRNEYKRESWS